MARSTMASDDWVRDPASEGCDGDWEAECRSIPAFTQHSSKA
jgi:hypothetical protein